MNLGGTSAGALAAALKAAAEYARQTGKGAAERAFDELSKIPDWLARDSPFGAGSNLMRLFQPQPGTGGLFWLGLSFLVKSWPKRLIMWFSALWLETLIGLARHYRKSRPEHLNPVRPIDTRRGRRVNRLSLISRGLTGAENETHPDRSLPRKAAPWMRKFVFGWKTQHQAESRRGHGTYQI
jgi:hypothetical protein